MSHVRRLLVTDRVFFVTVNLRRSIPALGADDYPLILHAIEESRRKLGLLLCGYVLMPDHWHALLGVRYPLAISRAVRDVKWIAARMLNRQRKTSGPVWQHQFWDRIVRHRKELAARFEYMHLNPVRKGLVKRREDWEWSSYNNYSLDRARGTNCPIQVDYIRL